MHLPLSFRVIEMRADESSHRVVIQEVRHPVLVGQLSGPRVSEQPPAVLTLEVTSEHFANVRIGQRFELEPQATEAKQMADNQFTGGHQSLGGGPALHRY